MSHVPSDLKYAESHEWLRPEGDYAVVGITDHAQGQLGDIVYVELPEEDDELSGGSEAAVVESVKAAGDVYAPVAGIVVEINSALADEPELINQDPYGEGWLFKIKLEEASQVDDLLSSDAYQEIIAEE